jgi:SPP1 gp7 family putative phage head morphogenesis protein
MIETQGLSIYQSGYDPTHTTILRNSFSRDIMKRFRELASVIKTSINTNDCFALKGDLITRNQMQPAQWQEFSYRSSQEKMTRFMEWLLIQVNIGILSINDFDQLRNNVNIAWFVRYLHEAYQKGVIRARYELRKAKYNVPSIDETGGISIVMSGSRHMDKLGLLYSSVFHDLQGITDQMDAAIGRVLANDLSTIGDASLLSRKITAIIDGNDFEDLGLALLLGRFMSIEQRANILARTAIVRVHHVATVAEYTNWDIENVTIIGEWQTAGDSKVCPKCAALEGKEFPLSVIEGMLPAHPLCRCIAIPKVKIV